MDLNLAISISRDKLGLSLPTHREILPTVDKFEVAGEDDVRSLDASNKGEHTWTSTNQRMKLWIANI